MQPDVKRGLVLGILVLAVCIVLWSHFQNNAGSVAVPGMENEPAPASDARPVSEPVVPSSPADVTDEAAESPGGRELPTGTPVEKEPATLAAKDKPPERASTSQAPAGNRFHTFKKDETLWTVAQTYYGNGGKWRLIYDANKATIPDPDLVAPGTRLVIPPEAAQKASAAETAQARQAAGRTHVVVAGESLVSIARKYYGDSKQWSLILKANQEKVPSPDKLRVGTVLVIPPAS